MNFGTPAIAINYEHIVYEGNFEGKSVIDFFYFEAPKNRFKRYFNLAKTIAKTIEERFDPTTQKDAVIMKCSHASGYNLIVKNKHTLNYVTAKKKFDHWLKTDYGAKTMERHYSGIKPQIIIEQYIGDAQHLPVEYKIHVFNGVARSLYVVTGRGEDIRYTNMYIDWTPFDGSQFNGWKKADQPLTKPANFDAMVKMAEDLARPFPFVRVDLYDVNGKIYFGEMTFTPAKGTLILDDDKADFEMGKWLDISRYLTAKKKVK